MYVLIQYIPFPEIIFLLAHYGWNFVHGAPALIYLTVNKSIRKRIFSFLVKQLNSTVTPTIEHTPTAMRTNEHNNFI
uniref:Uncharacterized protein n=1 Tax=Panagrolaimus sp. JU765 TaxID=591449 RepID=A0AC34PWR7_9BILA